MTLQEIIHIAGKAQIKAEHPDLKLAAKAIYHFAQAAKFRSCGEGFYNGKYLKAGEAAIAEAEARQQATQMFNAIQRPQLATREGSQLNPANADAPLPGEDHLIEIRGTWQCTRNRQLTIMILWNKARTLGASENELRDALSSFQVASRKELTDTQADELIDFLSTIINSLLKMKRGVSLVFTSILLKLLHWLLARWFAFFLPG